MAKNLKSESSLSAAYLQSFHLQTIDFVSPFTSPYIWQHEPFSLSIAISSSCTCTDTTTIPHLHGKLKYGDNLEDEWFAVFLLFRIFAAFPSNSIRVLDTDGEFLLIEAAFHLPRWLNQETSLNCVFIRGGDLHIVPRNRLPENPSLTASLRFLLERSHESKASESVQSSIKNRISDYPEKAWRNMHRVRVRVPISVAQVLRHEPLLISLAVEGFYDRDIDSMKHAAKMEKFHSNDDDLVLFLVKMSHAMYAQLVQQKVQAPSCYPMPSINDREAYAEAELGMKIACGMEMMYQQRKKDGEDGKGISWSNYKNNLEKNGYFEGLISGSKEYKRLIENAKEYYQKSSSFSRTRDVMSAPVRRIDEIIVLDDLKNREEEVLVSDNDSWLYDGEDELNSVLEERQKEMEFYNNSKKERKQKGKEKDNDFDLGDISKSMEQFMEKVSSYKGAEVPKNKDFKEMNLDVDRFMKDIESMFGKQDDDDDSEGSEGSSIDMDDFDDSEEEEEDRKRRRRSEKNYSSEDQRRITRVIEFSLLVLLLETKIK